MSIKLKELDEESKEATKIIEDLDFASKDKEITILVSKNILLKLTASQTSVFETNPMIRRLIMIPNLASKSKSDKLKEIVNLNKNILEQFSDYNISINRRNNFLDMFFQRRIKGYREEINKLIEQKNQESDEERLENMSGNIDKLKNKIEFFEKEKENEKKRLKQSSEKRIDTIKSNCDKIGEIEEDLGVVFRTNHIYRYCDGCFNLVMQEKTDDAKCDKCKSDAQPLVFGYLDDDVQKYLAGHWLEDYIAFLLRKKNWKTWVRHSVSGVSGINHEIDVLAIKDGYVLICECKTGRIKRGDIFSFSAKNFDIKSNYAFWFSLEGLPDTETEDYLKKTPGLFYLDNLCNLNRDDILHKINEISTF